MNAPSRRARYFIWRLIASGMRISLLLINVHFCCALITERNSLVGCQETSLVTNLVRLLETDQGKGAARKLDLKRKKMAAIGLTSLSRNS